MDGWMDAPVDEWMDREQACLLETFNFKAILRIQGLSRSSTLASSQLLGFWWIWTK